MTWLKSAVAAATPDQPLRIPIDGARGGAFMKVTGAGGRVTIAGPRMTRTAEWRDLAPHEIGSIAGAVGRSNPPTPRDAQRRRMWIAAFAAEYGLQPAHPPAGRK
jgi:hypothetical protein